MVNMPTPSIPFHIGSILCPSSDVKYLRLAPPEREKMRLFRIELIPPIHLRGRPLVRLSQKRPLLATTLYIPGRVLLIRLPDH
jgi:hypothetical protein